MILRDAVQLGSVLPLPVEQGRAEGQVAGAGGGGEERLALVEGHDQQVGLAEFVPENAFAVDPGGTGRAQGRVWSRRSPLSAL